MSAYVSENMPVTELLRVHGAAVPPEFHPAIEQLIAGYKAAGRVTALEDRLDCIAAQIVGANWRTGKKSDLQYLIEVIHDETDYSDIHD